MRRILLKSKQDWESQRTNVYISVELTELTDGPRKIARSGDVSFELERTQVRA